MRPVFIVLGKETRENLEDVKNTLKERKVDSFDLEKPDGTVVRINLQAEMSMVDGKMRAMVTGLMGAYCLLCTVDKKTACGISEEAQNAVQLESFFHINRSPEETKADYDRLVDENGRLKRLRGDYADRKGVTQEPLADENMNSVSPLHSLMRSFDFVKSLLYHLRSETFQWTESTLQLGRSAPFFTKAKDEVRERVLEETGLPLDAADPTGMGGNSNKGDLCKRLLTDHREVLVSLVPERFKDDFRELLCRIWVVVKLYTSNEKINSAQLKEFCVETYSLILNKFNNTSRWISISPTVHAPPGSQLGNN